MTTPTKHLQIFDEKYHIDEVGEYSEQLIPNSGEKYPIKQHLIQTVISVLEQEISEIESRIEDITEYQLNISLSSERDAYIKCSDSLTTTLSTWKSLL